jgi:hypothetical protein
MVRRDNFLFDNRERGDCHFKEWGICLLARKSVFAVLVNGCLFIAAGSFVEMFPFGNTNAAIAVVRSGWFLSNKTNLVQMSLISLGATVIVALILICL